MFIITSKTQLAKDTYKLIVEAPDIARNAAAGQFVVLIPEEKGERIPLTLAGWDKEKGAITIIFQVVGWSTSVLSKLRVNDRIPHIVGPLGHPTKVEKIGTVIAVGGGVGIAEVFPVSKAFKDAGNTVIGVIGARTKELIIFEKEMTGLCERLHITTDDGSYGEKGFVTDVVKQLLRSAPPDLVYAIGPVVMMKAVAEITRPLNIKTIVSVNPIMVDATGMCGACRCTVAGKTVFGCVDGPDFDAHQLDFDELDTRLKTFTDQEKVSFTRT